MKDSIVQVKNLRVLIVGPYPPPFGGIASHVTTLIPGLYNRGVADVALVQFGSTERVLRDGAASIYIFNVKQNFKKILNPSNWVFLFLAIRFLPSKLGVKAIFSEAVKAILIDEVANNHKINVSSFYQVDHSLSMIICSKKWKGDRGIVLTVFGEVYDEIKFFSRNKFLVKKMISIPDALVSSSLHCANGYSQFIGRNNIEAVYYGVDLDRFEDASVGIDFRLDNKISVDETLILYMGRFSELMGLDRVLMLIPDILSQFTNVKFLLAGAKGSLSDRANQCMQRFPENVFIMNEVSFAAQTAIYAASDIVLAPTRDQHACMGMSIKEAMAASKPVIGSAAGGVPEAIVQGETGLLIPLDDTKNIDLQFFKQGLIELIEDVTLRKKMGDNARKRAEYMFSMDKTIDRMTEIFLSTIPQNS